MIVSDTFISSVACSLVTFRTKEGLFALHLNVNFKRQQFFSLYTMFCLKGFEGDVLIRLESNSLRYFIVILIIAGPFREFIVL